MAYGRYLMPAYPVLLALAAAALASWRLLDRPRTVVAGIALAAAVVQNADFSARVVHARKPDTHAALAAWLHAHLPDGAQVVVDWWAPALPRIEAREEFGGALPEATQARFVPAFRVTQGYDYFAAGVNALSATSARVDDFAALRAHAPVWIVVSDDGERTCAAVAPDAPPARWYASLREGVPLVHEEWPGPDGRGPVYRVHVLR
jgi:hypothetical protein